MHLKVTAICRLQIGQLLLLFSKFDTSTLNTVANILLPQTILCMIMLFLLKNSPIQDVNTLQWPIFIQSLRNFYSLNDYPRYENWLMCMTTR